MTALPIFSAECPPSAADRIGKNWPIGALLLAGSCTAWAQAEATQRAPSTLSTVTVTETAEPVEVQGKTRLRASDSRIGKTPQALRDIPQSVTVMTERLLEDRNLEDFREVLKTTAGITFMAGETGEEDVRLRGFSLGQAGDIYVDGLKDAPLIERDTFNLERVEILKGSASMLFGKGSTGGVVNQVSKKPFLMEQHEVTAQVGSGQDERLTGDFNWPTGENAAVRLNVLQQHGNHHGATVDKRGLAPSYRWGIGERDEFSVGLYHLQTDGKPLYNHPWLLQNGTIVPTLPAQNYYGLSTDHLQTETTYATVSHQHRFDQNSRLRTSLRHGSYQRDLWASAVRFGNTNGNPTNINNPFNEQTPILRTPKGRVGQSDLTQWQTDLSQSVEAGGYRHEWLVGIDWSQENAGRQQSFAGTASGWSTTVGLPNTDCAPGTDCPTRVDRGTPILNRFDSQTLGVYAQDTVSLTPQVKLLAGLRWDRFVTHNRANTCNPVQEMAVDDSLLSPRLGGLYQPHPDQSYYVSFGTSFNTSGDTYAYGLNVCALPGSNNAKLLNTPPEKSRNLEVGGKFEWWAQQASLGVALFRSEKYNERNTDEPTVDSYLLSGKRHASGLEVNFAGRTGPQWEWFYNHTWIPSAQIDAGTLSGNGQREGDRPALTPKHSASLWGSYRFASQWRWGVGVNHRGRQSPEGNRTVVAPAFTTFDTMLEHILDERGTLKLNINNLTNRLYADALYRGFYVPGTARTVQVSYKHLF